MSHNTFIRLEKLGIQNYAYHLLLMLFCTIIGVLYYTLKAGNTENIFYIILIGILFLSIPLNQIFRIKRYHIYEIIVSDKVHIKYQDILSEKEVIFDLKELNIELNGSGIERCYKLTIKDNHRKITQYCNKYWTNDTLEMVNKQLSILVENYDF